MAALVRYVQAATPKFEAKRRDAWITATTAWLLSLATILPHTL
jgi:hypothetical protein